MVEEPFAIVIQYTDDLHASQILIVKIVKRLAADNVIV